MHRPPCKGGAEEDLVEAQPKRKRGAQPGNHNALKHGYYSKEFNRKEKHDLDAAAEMEGIDAEIALLRYEIKKSANGRGNIKNLRILVNAALALEKLIRTRHKVFAPENKFENAVRNVFRDIIYPLGGEQVIRSFAHELYPDEFPPAEDENQNLVNPPDQSQLDKKQ
jgi:hypothetical protein